MYFYLFILSSSITLVLLAFVTYLLTKKAKINPAKKQMTVDASELLRDLLSGGAITVTQVIDPSSILLRSPRDL